MSEQSAMKDRITGTLIAMAPVAIDDDTRRWAAQTAEEVVRALNLRAESVHVEGEWGFGARDEVQIRGYLS